jgi:hypothetical protein
MTWSVPIVSISRTTSNVDVDDDDDDENDNNGDVGHSEMPPRREVASVVCRQRDGIHRPTIGRRVRTMVMVLFIYGRTYIYDIFSDAGARTWIFLGRIFCAR